MEGQTRPTTKLKFIESKKRLRVSASSNSHQKLITSALNYDLTMIACEDNTVKCYQTSRLLDFNPGQVQILNDTPSNLISLDFKPSLLSVANHGNGSILLVAGINSIRSCPKIMVFDLDSQTSIGNVDISHLERSEVSDYAWHPNFSESLVAICFNRGHLLVLAVNKNEKGIGVVYSNDQYAAVTCCWSPKGKNLALGLIDGRILRLEPIIGDNCFSFKEVDGSTLTLNNSKISSEHHIVKLRWINKNYLLAVHAKLKGLYGPETVYSLITVKPSKPYLYWSNLLIENQNSKNYVVHIANLTNSVICATSAAGEAAIIGVLGATEAATNSMNDWNNLIVEEEGARIELPLDANNTETHPCGLTLTQSQDGRLILIICTSEGLICSFAIWHSENILKPPELQAQSVFKYKVPIQKQEERKEITSVSKPSMIHLESHMQTMSKGLKEARCKLDFNQSYASLLEDLNYLRDKLDEILDLHRTHKEAMDAVREDVDRLDLEVLETYYLIGYVKSRHSCEIKKKSIDPVVSKKVNNIKMKLKMIEKKIDDLNLIVDVAWENFLREKSTKDRSNSSVDLIYKTLVNHQRIISALKGKIEISPEVLQQKEGFSGLIAIRDENRKFEEFLASRSVVPVRSSD